MNELINQIILIVSGLSDAVKNLLPVDLSQLAAYLLIFKFLKINRLLNFGEERKAIRNSFIAIPAIILSIMYIIAIHQEMIINPMYIVGFTVAQDDFGFAEVSSVKYRRTKEIIWGVMLLVIAIKIGKILVV